MESATAHRPPPPRPPPPRNIALLPPPGFLGHLIPFIELAKKLVLNHNCTVTLIIPNDGSSMEPQKSLLRHIPTSINPVFLPPAPENDQCPPENSNPETLLPTRVTRSIPAIRAALSSLREMGTPAAALVVDLFAPYAIDVAREFGIPAYIFYVIAANELSLAMDLPKLHEEEEQQLHQESQIKLPGGIVLNSSDFPDSMKDRNSEDYKWALDLSNKYLEADGILVNSFLGLEAQAFHALEQGHPRTPPVYPVGPLIRTTTATSSPSPSDDDDDHACLGWLNNQPPKSVLFVSFGSGGTLSTEQFIELAFGLEMCRHRFLWVVRTPQENTSAAYLNTNNKSGTKDNPLEYLPKGFLERTKDRGFVVATWAPQIRVLSHGSVGGFVTHCGWNSILESSVFGVPMIAWPLCFEQKMSAVFLRDGLRGAIRVKPNELNGVVKRDHFSEVVKQLMDDEGEPGIKIRKRMMEVKIAAADVMDQEHGSSALSLSQLVHKWITYNPK
ncbi:hypothetical protein ABFS83_14G286600 [Erythranthe nasuta]